ncbi:MAG: M6 family metalloprotease domain-containing protein [Ignavibacteriae bacterium]|nr:M6 family metalloprotease domain-containing protein [Ignavibacteriota bacterium]
MKIKLFFLLILIYNITILYAAPIKNIPVTVKQPSGEILNIFASGDEFYNWLHDNENYTIIQDPSTGYYVYALKKNDELIPSKIIVGRTLPIIIGIERGLNISPEKMRAVRNEFFRMSPKDIGDAPKTGTINNLVVYIRFSGETEFTDLKSYYDGMFNNITTGANSMRNYFTEVSYNQLTISTTFYPVTAGTTVISYLDSDVRGYYQPYNAATNPTGYTGGDNGQMRTEREHTLLTRAVNFIASQVLPGLNIDGDNDGNVDNVCFIVSGDVTGWASLLWPHRWSLYTYTVNINGKRVYDYNFQIRNHLQSSGVGVLCHEMFHSLGSPDLYHYSYDGLQPVYQWDIMENDLNPPQHMGAYMKWKYGAWISNIPVISQGTYSLNPLVISSGNCYKINSPTSSSEFFVVEYRKRTPPFESGLPGDGLLVYRINPSVSGNSNGPPDEVYAYRPNGTLTVNGSPELANYNSSVGRVKLDSSTNPSPFLSNGTQSKLKISNIGSAGNTIAFTVGNIQGVVADFTSNKTYITPGEIVNFTDLSVGSPTNWSWSFTGGTPLSSTLQNPTGITYNNIGTYSVSLTATNTYGSNTITKSDYIIVGINSVIYTDNFDGDNTLTGLQNRGYKIFNQSVPVGTLSWFQGNATVFTAFKGPTTGYVGINFNSTAGVGNIDNWMILPRVAGGLLSGDSLFFYERSSTGSIYPDSIRVMYSANDSVPQGSWAELGRFKTNTTTGWQRHGFKATTASINGSFAIRYCVANGGPNGSNSDYVGIDALTIERSRNQQLTVPVTVISGWNIVSVPVLASDMSKTSLFPDAATPAYWFNNGYIANDTLKNGVGYFIRFNTGNTYNINGSILASKQIPVKQGWNMIGPFEKDVAVSGITSIPAGIIATSFFGFNNGYVMSDTLKTGKGYWVRVTQDGLLILPSNLLAFRINDNSSIPVTVNKGRWTRIRITDKNGQNGTLFIAKGEEMTQNYELPPVPPQGIFDIRYQSDSYAEMTGRNHVIRISSAEYPIQITAENMNGLTLRVKDKISGEIVNKELIEGQTITITQPIENLDIIEEGILPTTYDLYQNYPNPFNPVTKIIYQVPEQVYVSLKVYDILGRFVKTLVDETKNAGYYEVKFDAGNLASGIYFYKIQANKFTKINKLSLIK